MDKIIIKGLRIFSFQGVNEWEKEKGQPFVVDATLNLSLEKPCSTDNVEDTVNYSSVSKTIKRTMLLQKDDLIERAAQRLCDAILDEFEKVDSVTILLKKPRAPIAGDFEYVAVEITRKR